MNGDRIQQDSLTIKKLPYRCNICQWLYWFRLADIMRIRETHLLPCGHDWKHMSYAFDLDGSEPPQEVEV